MTCAEFQEQVAALAIDAVDAAERATLESHLSSAGPHSGCAEAYDRVLATAAELSAALPPVQPSDQTWQAIESRLVPGRETNLPKRSSGREMAAWLFAAAAVLLAVILGLALKRQTEASAAASGVIARLQADLAQTRQTLSQAQTLATEDKQRLTAQLQLLEKDSALQRDALALLDASGTQLVPFKAAKPGYIASALVNTKTRRAIVISSRITPQVGKDLELWVIRGKAPPIPAGLMKVTPQGVAVGEIKRELLASGMPDALAVSLEKAGGVNAPTTVVLVGPLKKG